MKRFEFISIIILFASVLLLCTDTENAANITHERGTEVLISKIETSFDGGQTHLPYGEYFYDEDNRIQEAIIWSYEPKEDGTIASQEYTYTFVRNGNTINVVCTEWADNEEYIKRYELKIDNWNRIIKKTKYESGIKMETVNYEWDENDRLIRQTDAFLYNDRGDTTHLTYNFLGNVESHIVSYIAPAYSDSTGLHRDTVSYEYNPDRRNVFSLYPFELAVVEEEYPEIYILGASVNEVLKFKINKNDTANVPNETTGEYTFEYNEDNWPERVMVDIAQRHKYSGEENSENDNEYTDSAYSMLFFSYIYR